MGKKKRNEASKPVLQESVETLTYLERKLKILNEMEDKALARRLAERLYMNYKEKTNEM